MSIEVMQHENSKIQGESVRTRRKALNTELEAIQAVVDSHMQRFRLAEDADIDGKEWTSARAASAAAEVEAARYISLLRFARPNVRIGVRGLVALTAPQGDERELIPLARGAHIEGRIAGVKIHMMPDSSCEARESERPLLASAMLRLRDAVIYTTDQRNETTSSEDFDEEVLVPLVFGNINAFPIPERSQTFTIDLARRAVNTYTNSFATSNFDQYLPEPNVAEVQSETAPVEEVPRAPAPNSDDVPDYIKSLPEGLSVSAEEPIRIMNAMQKVVLDFVQRLNLRIENVTLAEVESFIDKVLPQVAFETYGAELFTQGNILIATGAGGFGAVLRGDNQESRWQPMVDGDMLMGEIENVCVSLVPSRDCVLESANLAQFAITDYSMSASVSIKNAHYYTGLQPDGDYSQEVDLSEDYSTVILPAAYNMQVQIIPTEDLGPHEEPATVE